MFCPTMEPLMEDEWLGRRLPNSSSSTFCELHDILLAVTLLVRRRVNGIIMCDSQSALYALSSPRPSCGRVVQDILCQLAIALDTSLVVSSVWTSSVAGNDTVDRQSRIFQPPVVGAMRAQSMCRRRLNWSRERPAFEETRGVSC